MTLLITLAWSSVETIPPRAGCLTIISTGDTSGNGLVNKKVLYQGSMHLGCILWVR